MAPPLPHSVCAYTRVHCVSACFCLQQCVRFLMFASVFCHQYIAFMSPLRGAASPPLLVCIYMCVLRLCMFLFEAVCGLLDVC